MNNFIPVEANVNGKTVIWYMDISTLSLSDLIKLKKELNGNKIENFIFLDAIIHDMIGYNKQDLKSIRRENQKDKSTYRNQKAFVRKKRKGRR